MKMKVYKSLQDVKTIFTLEDYEKAGSITATQKKFLIDSIKGKKNILIVGGALTGKTTLLKACIDQIKDTDRVIILEEAEELLCKIENNKDMYVTDFYVDMQTLAKSCMRQRPDRIILGEKTGTTYNGS